MNDAARDRRTSLVIAGLTLIGLTAIALLAVDWVRGELRGYEPDCDEYAFEREEWRDAGNRGIDDDSQEHQAEALAECDALVGLTRAEVTAMLGSHQLERRIEPFDWGFSAGWVNDGMGPGDGQMLYVQFGDDGHVTRAKLAYPQ